MPRRSPTSKGSNHRVFIFTSEAKKQKRHILAIISLAEQCGESHLRTVEIDEGVLGLRSSPRGSDKRYVI
jgi:hypothetical protein